MSIHNVYHTSTKINETIIKVTTDSECKNYPLYFYKILHKYQTTQSQVQLQEQQNPHPDFLYALIHLVGTGFDVSKNMRIDFDHWATISNFYFGIESKSIGQYDMSMRNMILDITDILLIFYGIKNIKYFIFGYSSKSLFNFSQNFVLCLYPIRK